MTKPARPTRIHDARRPGRASLRRKNNETTVNLAQKIPAAAAKGEVLPKPGQARLLLGNLGDTEAAITINKQTVKIAAGAGGPHTKGPTMDLPPGKYKYAVKVARPSGPKQRDQRWGRRCLGRDDCAR